MRENDLTLLGEHYGLGRTASYVFGIARADRRQGLHLIGQSGTGKSSLLLSMIQQDIARGEGITLIDPHGLLAEQLLDHIPPERMNDVCYFNVADAERPIGFNILQTNLPRDKQHLTVSAVVAAISGIWNLTPERAPRLLNILKYGVAALLETPDATLLSLERLLTDEAYRVRTVIRHSNEAVRRYWLEAFDTKDARLRSDAIDPVLTRVSDSGIVPLMQRIIGQPRSGFDPRAIMDGRKILIVNLDIGQIGEENAQLLGALLVTKLELAARSRSDTPGASLPDHYLYVDEFHRFPNERWANILSGIRAYGLACTLAHQYGEQLSGTTRSAVYGSVGSTIAFRTGQPDAEELSKHYRRDLTEPQFTGLDNHEINARLLVGGRQEIFQGRTLPFDATHHGLKAEIIERSRERFGIPRERLVPMPTGPREKRLREYEKLLNEKGGLRTDSPTAIAHQIIKGERPVATPPSAPAPRPRSATRYQTDHPREATQGLSPETDRVRFRRKFQRRFERRFASLLRPHRQP
jgi:hypothetical protein